MTLIKHIKTYCLLLSTLFLFSCDYLKKSLGVSKNIIDDSQSFESPELVLPPDFNITPKNENVNSYSNNNEEKKIDENRNIIKNAYDIPSTKNFLAPKVPKPLANSPSDSIKKFSNSRNFTLGEWVYQQSIDDFRSSNFYYIPNYEKGYNFSRKYVPRQFRNKELQNQTIQSNNIIQNRNFEEKMFDSDSPSSQSIGELPVLE
ncbi:MAG: hypothetical protein CMM91_09545 [Rickettsiales bacterium]|mgnify:CR=1 FL=1|nr:hypothetical protein [Rickettsiales bacterium]OUV53279.1 MAG: hypothetical protein CBC87_05260 [Rickettsiales bacterium TMED127]|tara:strand:+ start:12808 stop:13416 length:609 start_codon:yes stop_codon:yes gene_type:complete